MFEALDSIIVRATSQYDESAVCHTSYAVSSPLTFPSLAMGVLKAVVKTTSSGLFFKIESKEELLANRGNVDRNAAIVVEDLRVLKKKKKGKKE